MTFKPPKKPNPSSVVGIRLSKEHAAWLRRYAKKHDVSIGSMARAIVEQTIDVIRGKKGSK